MRHEKISISVGMRTKRATAITLLIIYLTICMLSISAHIIQHAEEHCIQRLEEATLEFGSTYYDHAMSDREQLGVVADMLSVLMNEDTHDLHIHLAAFEQRGLLDWLQVLLPDGSLLTGSGTYDLSQQMNFQEEVARLPYISNVSDGLVDPSKHVIRSAVPIILDGETVAVLYGVYDLTAGHVLDGVTAYGGKSHTFVMEADTGHYILNGLMDHGSSCTVDSHYEPKPGFDLSAMQADLAAGKAGYSAFRSLTLDEYMYIYYAPIGINNWMVMVSVPESAALDFAYHTQLLLINTAVYLTIGVMLYFFVAHQLDKKIQAKNRFVSGVQSQLMEVYHKPDHYHDALLAVADRARSSAAFVLDEKLPLASTIAGQDQSLVKNYQQQAEGLTGEILSLCRQHKRNLYLRPSSKLLRDCPRLRQFLTQQGERSLLLSPVTLLEGELHQVMGVFSPGNTDAPILLNALAADFFIAANNIDYLTRLNIASTVDNLTGTLNRTSYHLQLEMLCTSSPERLACVYVDVNDLHAVNNRFGHDQGDAMLRTIAKALMDSFGSKNVYRFGGDEFIILAEGVAEEWVTSAIAQAENTIHEAGYTVSIGYDWADRPTNVDGMIRTAESRMYQAKYLFYQEKEKRQAAKRPADFHVAQRLVTGNPDIDAFLLATSSHYRGVYIVDLKTDAVREILAHNYLHAALEENDQVFSKAFRYYMSEVVDKQSRRSIQNFFDYRSINAQAAANDTSIVEYTKVDGERVRITVHPSPDYTPEKPETLWIFEAT